MPATHDLWGNPIPPDPPPAPRPKPKKTSRFANGLPNDVIVWLLQNEPQNYDELMDLRHALYSRKTHGIYAISPRGLTLGGEEKFVLTGPVGSVLILSNKARHFLLRTLCRLRRKKRWPPIRYQ